MNYKRYIAKHKNIEMIIKEDLPEVGAYLFVSIDGKPKYDYLQNSINDCKDFAFEDFSVPQKSWKRISDIKR